MTVPGGRERRRDRGPGGRGETPAAPRGGSVPAAGPGGLGSEAAPGAACEAAAAPDAACKAAAAPRAACEAAAAPGVACEAAAAPGVACEAAAAPGVACVAAAAPGGTSPAAAEPGQRLGEAGPGQRLADACAAARARPYHLVVAAVVAGLLAAPRSPLLVAAALAVVVAVAAWPAPVAPRGPAWPGARRRAAAAGVLAVLGGATVADLRLAALAGDGHARAAIGRAVEARVVVLEAPRARAGGARAAVVRWRGERVLLRSAARVGWPPAGAGVGAVLVVRGRMAALAPHDGWLRPRHVQAVLVAADVRATGIARGGVAGALDGVRLRAEAALTRAVPAEQGALLRGMVLGQDDALPDDVRDAFRRTGLSHLVAASGQNVLLLAGLALGVAIVVGLGLRARLALVLALIALYVPLAGAGPSIQRAGVMGAAGVVALLAGRPAARWHALGLAAAVTLGLNPRACEEPGWQMSFAAVAALLALGPRLRDGLRRRRVPAGVAEAVAVTIAATLGTAPLVALHFERTSLVAIPANVLVAPAVAPAMWLGMLAAAVGQVTPAVGGVLGALAGWPAAYVGAVAHAGARVPLADAAVPVPAVAAACALVAAAVVRPRLRRWLPAAALAGLAAALAAAPAPARPPAGPRIAFLDVGQGDATLLQHGRHAILVDAGPPGSPGPPGTPGAPGPPAPVRSPGSVAPGSPGSFGSSGSPSAPVVAALRAAGAHRLDVLVATHAQADHVGGAAAVLDAVPVGLVLDGRDGVREPHGDALAAAARRRGVRLVRARAGQVLRAGPLRLVVHWPPATPAVPGTDPNERAVVAEALVGGARVLLPADAEGPVLTRLALGRADVLKVAHHGSADEALPAVLAAVRPRLAVIEVGRRNPYGHPAASTLGALARAAVPTLRTDRDGTVLVTPRRDGSLAVERRRPGEGPARAWQERPARR